MGVIISVVNNKGGTGKTTTTVNLGAALVKKGKTVLVADMDNQCNATAKLLPPKMTIRRSLYDILASAEYNMTDIMYSENGLALLPNLPETANLEPALISSAPDSFFYLRNVIREYATRNFDYTLIDCPPNMGTFVIISLLTSDFVVVPVKAGSTDSVEGLIRATDLVRQIAGSQNPDLKFLRILINFVDRRTTIAKSIISQIRQTFSNDQVFETEIPVNTTFERAEARNQTIFEYDPTATGARAFRKLANELISILEE